MMGNTSEEARTGYDPEPYLETAWDRALNPAYEMRELRGP